MTYNTKTKRFAYPLSTAAEGLGWGRALASNAQPGSQSAVTGLCLAPPQPFRRGGEGGERKQILYLSIALLILLTTPPLHAQPARALVEFAAKPALKPASWGFAAFGLNSGKVLASHDAGRVLMPASTAKAVTTATALAVLGADWQASTTLAYKGELSAGILRGDLLIDGDGDPSLGSGRFGPASTPGAVIGRWVAAIQKAGIAKVEGRLIVNASRFAGPYIPAGWPYGDIGNYYGAPIYSFAWRENFFTINFKTGKQGTEAKLLGTDPPMDGYAVINRVKAGAEGRGDQAYVYPLADEATRLIAGTLPPNQASYSIKAATANPAEACARELAQALGAKGIVISGAVLGLLPHGPEAERRLFMEATPKTVLDRLPSPTLGELGTKTNLYSLNLYAETLCCLIGQKMKGTAGTEAGVTAIEEYWNKTGTDPDGFALTDGSGLSLTNAISAMQMAGIMRQALQNPQTGKIYLATLPTMGETGTLADWCKGTPAAGRIHAKTGTLTQVLCLTGIAYPRKGEPIVFALMVNRYSGQYTAMRRALERLCVRLVG